jgi:hypothetical protein
MRFQSPKGQNDFLEVAALQKLIVSAMKELNEKPPQELTALLGQVFKRYNAASSDVQSEVAQLVQELRNLIGDFEPLPTCQSRSAPSRRWKFRSAAPISVGFAAIAILGAVGFQSIRQSTAIVPAQSPAFTHETNCMAVNPDRVSVSGYQRQDGISVSPYVRTAPNSTKSDNLSCK